MSTYSIYAFLASAFAPAAAAFPWAGPEPTLIIPERDAWSPAPTEGPKLGAMELLKRQFEDNTCGYISGELTESLTCNNAGYVCATNTFYGVHGCCDPASMDTCTLYTSCVESASLSASCDSDCSSDDFVAKCTESAYPFCYQWRYVYESTIMTEHGCGASRWTQSAWRTASGQTTATPSDAPNGITDDFSFTLDPSPTSFDLSSLFSLTNALTSSPTSDSSGLDNTDISVSKKSKKKSSVGAIAGGVVGGIVILGALLTTIVIKRRKKTANSADAAASQPFMSGAAPGGPGPGVTEYKPQPQVGVVEYPAPQQQYPAQPYPGCPPPPQQMYPAPAAGMGAAQGYYDPNAGPEKQVYAHVAPVPPTSPAPQYQVAPPQGIAEVGGDPVMVSPTQQQQYGVPQMGQQQMGMQGQGQQRGNVYEAP